MTDQLHEVLCIIVLLAVGTSCGRRGTPKNDPPHIRSAVCMAEYTLSYFLNGFKNGLYPVGKRPYYTPRS